MCLWSASYIFSLTANRMCKRMYYSILLISVTCCNSLNHFILKKYWISSVLRLWPIVIYIYSSMRIDKLRSEFNNCSLKTWLPDFNAWGSSWVSTSIVTKLGNFKLPFVKQKSHSSNQCYQVVCQNFYVTYVALNLARADVHFIGQTLSKERYYLHYN